MAERGNWKDVATNLSVHISTVWRVIKLFEDTGSVVKRPYLKGRRTKKLTDVIKVLILHVVISCPGMYLQNKIYSLTAVNISATSLCNFLKTSGLVDKKWGLWQSREMMNSLVMYRFTNDICSCLWMKQELIVETLSEDMDTALMEEPLNHVKY